MQYNRLGGEPRHEQKYFIGPGDYARLSSLLYSVLPLDAHAELSAFFAAILRARR